MNKKSKKRYIRTLKGPIKWLMPDGTVVDDTVADFNRRTISCPYIPLQMTPPVKPRS